MHARLTSQRTVCRGDRRWGRSPAAGWTLRRAAARAIAHSRAGLRTMASARASAAQRSVSSRWIAVSNPLREGRDLSGGERRAVIRGRHATVRIRGDEYLNDRCVRLDLCVVGQVGCASRYETQLAAICRCDAPTASVRVWTGSPVQARMRLASRTHKRIRTSSPSQRDRRAPCLRTNANHRNDRWECWRRRPAPPGAH